MPTKTHFRDTQKWGQDGAFYHDPGAGYGIGNTWYVNSAIGTDSTGFGYSPDSPLKTIAYAVATAATASNGDRVFVAQQHAEAIASGGNLNFSKAGVQVIGLGTGTDRPTITFNGTNSIITFSTANCMLKNVVLKCGIDEVVTAISVTAAFAVIDGVDVVEASSKQFIQFCLTSAAATDLTIQNCVHHQSTASASNALWIQLIGADRCRILNNWIAITTTNSASSSVIESDTTAPVNILIANNTIVQLGGASVVPINLVASTSGMVAYNNVASPKTAIAGSIACANTYAVQNFALHTVNKSGLLEPAVDT